MGKFLLFNKQIKNILLQSLILLMDGPKTQWQVLCGEQQWLSGPTQQTQIFGPLSIKYWMR